MIDPSPAPATRTRRLRFGLRTLFVLVTIVACWLGYSMNWIHQRREALASGTMQVSGPDVALFFPPRAPGGLWLFGEKGEYEIIVPSNDEGDGQRAIRLFPEARVCFLIDGWIVQYQPGSKPVKPMDDQPSKQE